jgi:hypothetical protein
VSSAADDCSGDSSSESSAINHRTLLIGGFLRFEVCTKGTKVVPRHLPNCDARLGKKVPSI